jgi:alpha-L-arabinofuranosidase
MTDIRFTISDQRLFNIDTKIFGNFLERPSWGGEIGVEGALIPGTHELQPEVLTRLKEMQIPILRFPGGSDVDYVDWRDMIDNVPGRPPGERPISTPRGSQVANNFGYDEYLRLCEDLRIEMHLVVNFADAFLKRKPLAEAALQAASMVAYCNAPIHTPLPDGMVDWPAVRAKNGHPEPYQAKYWEIGNENWFFVNTLQSQGLDFDEIDRWYLECLATYVEAMLAVDPTLRILVDVQFKRDSLMESIRAKLGHKVQYFVEHVYTPWSISEVLKDGQNYAIEALTDEDVWSTWVVVPDLNGNGESVFNSNILNQARRLGYKLGITEWNWNGWWSFNYTPGDKWPPDSNLARGIGAAGYLHAFMRAGDAIEVGSQSLTVGNRWGITGIRADRNAETPAYYLPTGQVIMFYAKHHGDWLLQMQSKNVPTYRQPFQMGGLRPAEKVAYIDALATADDKTIYFHAVNRHFSEDLPIIIDLSAFSGLPDSATQYLFEGRLHNAPQAGESQEVGWFKEQGIRLEGSLVRMTLPKRSISCVGIGRSQRPAYAVEYLAHDTPAVAVAGQTSPVQITVRNSSARTWSAGGQHPFHLGYHWYTSEGHEVPASLWDDNRAKLPYDLAPGDSVPLTCNLGMPRNRGNYEVRWDMVEELRTWFAWQGVSTLNVQISVNEEVVDPPVPAGLSVSASHHNRQAGIDNLQQAIDNNPATRWSSQTPQRPGMWFQIDLGQIRSINQLRLNNDQSPRDFPRGYVVKLSLDKHSWSTVAENPRNDRPLDVTFSPRRTRFIRIEQTGSDPTYWWAIHRIDISDKVAISARASHNNTLTGADNVSHVLDEQSETRWSSRTPQQPGMWFEIDLNEIRLVSGLALDTSGSPNDYPRGYSLHLATDRNHWVEIARRDRNTGPLNVNFSPRPARYIYIEQTGSSSNWWWSIHEVIVRSTEFKPGLQARASHNNVLSGADNVSQALDGRPETRWSSRTSQQPGMWFEIDLNETRTVGGLTLDTAGSSNDYPRGFSVRLSTDHIAWEEVARNDHNDRPLDINFNPHPVRYIRIEQTGHSTSWWWSIHRVGLR